MDAPLIPLQTNTDLTPLPLDSQDDKSRQGKNKQQKFDALLDRLLKEMMYPQLCNIIYIDSAMRFWFCSICRRAGIKHCAMEPCMFVKTDRILSHCNKKHHINLLDNERHRLHLLKIQKENEEIEK